MTYGASPAPRLSADGIELPAATPDRKFHPKIALAGAILGQRPEDVGRVFNASKSAPLLAKHTILDPGCEWFVLNIASADVAGLGLTDGRVSKLALCFNAVSPTRLASLQKQVGGGDHAVRVGFKPIENDKKQSLTIVFEVDPIEFYLIHHAVDGKIADAMRRRTWVAEMTDEQALLIGDGPGKYIAIFSGENKGDGTGAGTVFADGAAVDSRIEIQARNKQDAREQALKRHKNLKDLFKAGSDADKAKPAKGN